MRGDQIIQRASALTIPCPHCGALVGRECFDPRTGYVLVHQPAHSIRLREAGVL